MKAIAFLASVTEAVGEQLCIDGYIVTIERADGRRVQQVHVQRVAN